MDTELRQLLAELEAFGAENDAREEDRAKKMLNLERETAHLISILIRSSQRKHLLEIGTSNGYSTIWLGRALPDDGRLITLEYEPKHADVARAHYSDFTPASINAAGAPTTTRAAAAARKVPPA